LIFFQIALNVILPIFVVMGLGYYLARCFTIDLGTLSKLNFFIFIPVFMFYSLLIFKPTGREMAETVLFNLFLATLSFLLMFGLTRFLRLGTDLAAASTLAAVIFNSANYGIPVVQLAFHNEGVAVQIITITTMNVLTYTLGVFIAGGWNEWRKGIKTIFQLPILYALLGALALRALNLGLPDALMTSLKWTSDGMVPIALLTLGAQLGQGGFSLRHPREIWLTVAMRLLAGPLLAFLILKTMGLQGLLAQVLFVSSAFPTAVITVLFGIEYNRKPRFMADLVLITTLLSAVTVTLAIRIAPLLF
jgi:malate permease and related proteins